MEIATHMVLFANVVDHGSFSATARSLGLTPSAVSKQIGHLEDRLGVRLLNRSTRHISLTEEGQVFYKRCADIAAGVSEAEAMAISLGKRPQGTLRVAATVAFGKSQLLPILPAFLKDHPDLGFKLDLTDQHVDMNESGYDLAIRFTEQIDDASLIACKLARNLRVICASPAYVEEFGMPETLDDLSRHNCLRISTVNHWNDWHFGTGTEEKIFHAAGNFETDSADAIYHAALAGLGIARLSTYLVGDNIREGRLLHLLPSHCDEQSDIVALYPDRRNLSPKVRAFVDFLVDKFRPVPPWELPDAKQRLARSAAA